jgi:hypothetical protein
MYIISLTIFTLYANDLRISCMPKSADGIIEGLLFTCFLLFMTEMCVLSWVQPKYLNSVFFWLDLIALFSLIPDVPFFAEAIFGSESNIQDMSVTRATRTARIGSQAGRFFRLIKVTRLLRLLRMLRLLRLTNFMESNFKVKRRDTRSMQSEMSRTVVESISKRVVCIVLLVVVVCFLCQQEWSDHSRSNALYRLNQFDAATGNHLAS